MAENSKIEWTDHTVNFWWGCAKVSPACANCYAETQDARFYCGQLSFENGREVKLDPHWGPDAPRLLRVDAARREAIRYENRAVKLGRRFRVFTNSMSDFFEDRRDLDQARIEALDVIRQTPNLDWLILTKRPERVLELLRRAEAAAPGSGLSDWLRAWLHGQAPANVWLGTTVEDQERADQRIPALLRVPARVRFLSCEPLLSPISFRWQPWAHQATGETYREYLERTGNVNQFEALRKIDWMICGGESGHHARPIHPDWARGLRDQCAAAGVPFHFKQWGEWVPVYDRDTDDPDWRRCDDVKREAGHLGQWLNLAGGQGFHGDRVHMVSKVGKRAAGRLLDGMEHNGVPEVVYA